MMDISPEVQLITSLTGESCDNCSLAQRAAEHVRGLIKAGTLVPDSQLPYEPDLSSLIKVSRRTVLSALTILEQSGFVHRRWGIGTFIAKNPPTYNNLSINSGVTQPIQSSGTEAGFAEKINISCPASVHVTNRFSTETDSPIWKKPRKCFIKSSLRFAAEVCKLTLRQIHVSGGDRND